MASVKVSVPSSERWFSSSRGAPKATGRRMSRSPSLSQSKNSPIAAKPFVVASRSIGSVGRGMRSKRRCPGSDRLRNRATRWPSAASGEMKSRSLRPSRIDVSTGHRRTDAEIHLATWASRAIQLRQQAPIVGKDDPRLRVGDLREVERSSSLIRRGPQHQSPGQHRGHDQQRGHRDSASQLPIERASRPGEEPLRAKAPSMQEQEAAGLHGEGRVEEREETLGRVEEQIEQRDQEGHQHLPARRGRRGAPVGIMKKVNR